MPPVMKWHQMDYWAIMCWDYKQLRKISWIEKCPQFNLLGWARFFLVSLFLPLSSISAPFLLFFSRNILPDRHLNTIKSHSFFIVLSYCLFLNENIFNSMYDYPDHRKREQIMKTHRQDRAYNQIDLNCLCVNKNLGLSFWNRILLVLQTSD